jgi:hypothetical protein
VKRKSTRDRKGKKEIEKNKILPSPSHVLPHVFALAVVRACVRACARVVPFVEPITQPASGTARKAGASGSAIERHSSEIRSNAGRVTGNHLRTSVCLGERDNGGGSLINCADAEAIHHRDADTHVPAFSRAGPRARRMDRPVCPFVREIPRESRIGISGPASD